MANVSVIPEDYDILKKEYMVVRKELDTANQELYGSKRQLKVLEALQLEYQSEIETLQSEEIMERLKYEEKIAVLEENVTSIRLKCNERVQILEVDMTKKDEENEALRAEIELLKKVNAASAPADDSIKLLDEVVMLRSEKDFLLKNEEDLQQTIENLQKNCSILEETVKEQKAEILNLQETLSCKREEVTEAKDLIQKLNDEIFCIKGELESYKSRPLNVDSKGNSLFAEVDDRRVYLQKTINSMKSEYILMKQERARHLNTISRLRKENRELCERWKADIEEKEDDQDMILKAYKEQIHTLEDLIESYKRDLSTKPVVISIGSFSEIEFYQEMFNTKLKEIEELRSKMSEKASSHVMLSMALKEADKEIRKWRLEVKLMQCKLDLKADDTATKHHLECEVDKKTAEIEPEQKVYNNCSKYKEETCRKETVKIKESPIENFVDIKQEPEENLVDIEKENSVRNKTEDLIDFKSSLSDTEMENSEVTNEESSEKENIPDNNEARGPRKVTFSQNTTSPKVTDRTTIRRNCRRLEVPKPVFF